MILVQFQRHSHTRSYHRFQQIEIGKDPFVTGACYAEITFEQCVQAVQEEFDVGDSVVGNCTQSTST